MKHSWTAALAAAGLVLTTCLCSGPAVSATTHPAAATKAAPRIAITLSPSRFVTYDGSLSADVSVSGSKGRAAGEVTVDGLPGGDCEAVALDHGQTNCGSDELMSPLGTHTVTVHYSGDRNYRAATKTAHVQVTRAWTNVDIAESPQASGTAGHPVRFTVQLSDDAGNVPQRGHVSFSALIGSTYSTIARCGVITVTNSGKASCTTTLKAGDYTIVYAFTGSPHFAPVSVSAPYVVKAAS